MPVLERTTYGRRTRDISPLRTRRKCWFSGQWRRGAVGPVLLSLSNVFPLSRSRSGWIRSEAWLQYAIVLLSGLSIEYAASVFLRKAVRCATVNVHEEQ
jgi:hypothetical protein